MPTPVLVDSMTGNREMMIRWCEFVSLAFLMTFLTDSLDTAPTARPWFHSIALGCICLCGLLLPILSVLVVPNIDVADVTVVSLAGGAVWYLLLSVAVMLYIYVMDLYEPKLIVPLHLIQTIHLERGRAYVGFTAATGDTTRQNHDIIDWSFSSLRMDAYTFEPTVANGGESFQ